MQFVQTLYCSGSDTKKNGYGWAAPKFHYFSWILSCKQITSCATAPILYTNKAGGDMLIGELDLPYFNVESTPQILDNYPSNLWALSKIFTYANQSKPFIHIDGDVYLFQPLPERILSATLIAQNIEVDAEIYNNNYQCVFDTLRYIPEIIINDRRQKNVFKAYNAGIIGGNDIQFIQYYAKYAIDFIDQNIRSKPLPNIYWENLNVFMEQYLYYLLARRAGLSVTCLLDESAGNHYIELSNFSHIPKQKEYLHLLGGSKSMKISLLQLENHVKEYYNRDYLKVIKLFSTTSYFGNISGTSEKRKVAGLSSFLILHQEHKELIIKTVSVDKDFVCSSYILYLTHVYKFISRSELYTTTESASSLALVSSEYSIVDTSLRFHIVLNYKIINTLYDWTHTIDNDEYHQILMQRIACPPQTIKILVQPHSCERGYVGYRVQPFDEAMIALLQKPLTLADIYDEVGTWFPSQESVDDIIRLVIDSLRDYISYNFVKVFAS